MRFVGLNRPIEILGFLAVIAAAAALGCSAQNVDAQATSAAGASDPCAGLVEPSVMSLQPGSKHETASGGDPEYKATLEALVRARLDVTNKETEANVFVEKSRAEIERDRLLRDSGTYSNWRLATLDLEKVCLELDEDRLARLSSASFRKAEIARLQTATKSLQLEAALSADAFRRMQVERIARMTQEAKRPEQLLANVKARIAAATQARDTLAKAGVK